MCKHGLLLCSRYYVDGLTRHTIYVIKETKSKTQVILHIRSGTMSRFSGKCDFCDEIEIFGLDMILKSKVYVGSNDTPLELKTLEDCIPYYPYVVSGSFTNKDIGGVIHLTEKSCVDIEEERYGHMSIHDYYRSELKSEMEKHKCYSSTMRI